MALDYTVLQRFSRIVDEAAPIRTRNSCRKQIWIECGLADHCEHFTGARVERNARAHMLAGIMLRIQLSIEHVLGGTLQIKVDGGYEIVAGNRILFLQLSHLAAETVNNHPLE